METNHQEVIFRIKEDSDIHLDGGIFSQAQDKDARELNEIIRKKQIRISASRQPGVLSGERELMFYRAVSDQDISDFLEKLQHTSWVEYAYLKPASEDPAGRDF